jgi:NADH dehydrogenase/NADH:ubiquinone oxidoreductase subunit G
MANVTINGQAVAAAKGQSILEAAQGAGIIIPTLCFHPDLSVTGSCRLCLVEIEGHQGLVAACSHRIYEGMVIQTETPSVIASRRFVLELLLLRYVDHGDAAGHRESTEFLRWVKHYGARLP